MTSPAPTPSSDAQLRAVFRRAAWVAAVAALLAGALALLFPAAALSVVSLVVGTYLVVAGILRIGTAISSDRLTTTWRGIVGGIGALLVVAGILALNNPFGTAIALVIVTAVGWIVDGVGYLVAAFRLGDAGIAWPFAAAGAVLVVAGIVLLVLPREALGAIFLGIAVLLLVVGGVGLVALILSTRRARAAR